MLSILKQSQQLVHKKQICRVTRDHKRQILYSVYTALNFNSKVSRILLLPSMNINHL